MSALQTDWRLFASGFGDPLYLPSSDETKAIDGVLAADWETDWDLLQKSQPGINKDHPVLGGPC